MNKLFLNQNLKKEMKMKLFIITISLISLNCYQKPSNENFDGKSIPAKTFYINDQSLQLESKTTTEVNLEALTQEINREELIRFAKTFLGTPYIYAKQDPKIGFDCSGFINYIFKNYNITVPRSSSGFKNFGRKIDVDEVKVGDVLVFNGYRDSTSIGHLGIVCEAAGVNSKFIHASSGKVMQVTISDLNSNHYANRFHHAVDVIEE